jgi:hypothetical protein
MRVVGEGEERYVPRLMVSWELAGVSVGGSRDQKANWPASEANSRR